MALLRTSCSAHSVMIQNWIATEVAVAPLAGSTVTSGDRMRNTSHVIVKLGAVSLGHAWIAQWVVLCFSNRPPHLKFLQLNCRSLVILIFRNALP